VTAAFNTRREKHNKSRKDAKQAAPDIAIIDLKTNYVDPLLEATYKPKTHVCLGDMQKENTECSALINETANAIDDDILKLLFVSVQQNNLDLCIEQAVRRLNRIVLNAKIKGTEDLLMLIREVLAWFPHIWKNTWNYERVIGGVAVGGWYYRKQLHDAAQACLDMFRNIFPEINGVSIHSPLNHSQMFSLGAVSIICARHSFSLSDTASVSERLQISIDLYQSSQACDVVAKAVQQAFCDPSILTQSGNTPTSVVDKLLSIIQDNSLLSTA